MTRVICEVYGPVYPCTAHFRNSSKFTQVMNNSGLTHPVVTLHYYYSTPYSTMAAKTTVEDDDEEVMVIPELFTGHVIYGN